MLRKFPQLQLYKTQNPSRMIPNQTLPSSPTITRNNAHRKGSKMDRNSTKILKNFQAQLDDAVLDFT